MMMTMTLASSSISNRTWRKRLVAVVQLKLRKPPGLGVDYLQASGLLVIKNSPAPFLLSKRHYGFLNNITTFMQLIFGHYQGRRETDDVAMGRFSQ